MKINDIILELKNPEDLTTVRKELSKQVTSVDTRDNSWMRVLTDVLPKHGFNHVSRGRYASVFSNDKYPYVLKVFMKDSAYIRWIKFCMQNQGNKYVPKIKGKVVKITPMVYAIRLEKLDPTASSRPPSAANAAFYVEYSNWQKDPSYVTEDTDLQSVFELFQQNRNLLDMHGENFMNRGSQVVIIDPFYNWFNKDKHMDYSIDPDKVDPSVF